MIHGTGTHGVTDHGITEDGMTLGITAAGMEVGTTLGITEVSAGMTLGIMEVFTSVGGDPIIADGTGAGILIGDIITGQGIILEMTGRSMDATDGMV